MTDPAPNHSANDPAGSDFGSTRWSVVLAAGRISSADAREALALLCQHYWYPLYAYVRRRAKSVDEAQDLIQEFFARLLEHNLIGKADPERGRFRCFLLTALRNFLANEWAKAGRPSAVKDTSHCRSICGRANRATWANRWTR